MRKKLLSAFQSLLLVTLMIIPVTLSAQNSFTVTGTVVGDDDEPLPGVTVMAQDGKTGAATDIDGQFSITLSKPTTLTFSYIGYEAQKQKVSNGGTLNVVLKTNATALDDVVVVGYGTQRKVNLTGAVQSVSSQEILRSAVSNGSSALQGIIPGLTAQVTSGQPGADQASLRIRGLGSLNSTTSPLILIDGVEGDMNRIDLNTVESISVLKDAASASIYGSRASNGVILITTKRGAEGKPKVTFNGYVGFNKPTAIPKTVNGYQYMQAINQARLNNDQDILYGEDILDLYASGGVDNIMNYDTDWVGLMLKDHAMVENYSVSVSGGSKNLNVFASAGYYKQDGLIANNNFERMSIKLNTDLQVNKWLKVGVDMSVRQGKAVRPTGADARTIISYALTFNPLMSGLNGDGTLGYGLNGNNPYAIVSNDEAVVTSVAPEYVVRPTITITPFDGLTIFGTYSWKRNDGRTVAYNEPYECYEYGVFKGYGGVNVNAKSEEWSATVRKQFNAMATYEKTFIDKHYLKAMVGFQSEEINSNTLSARRTNFEYEGYHEITNGDPSTATNGSSKYGWSMLSYLFRVNYAFDNRYLLEVNGRYDGTSRFKSGKRWGFFPSFSAGWRISQENFWESARDVMDNFKLRASYGLLGNEAISGYYPYAASIGGLSAPTDADNGGGYWFDGDYNQALGQTQLANPHITWEKSRQFDVGIDYGFLNSRLSGSVDFYYRHIDDMLQKFPVPIFVGMSSPWQNAGSMRNIGWELSINWNDRIGNVNYYVKANLSDVQNKILDLYGNEYKSGSTLSAEGFAYNSWYGYVADGLYQNQAEIDPVYNEDGLLLNPVYNGDPRNVKPGYIKYKDISGPEGKPDGKIDDHDRTILGNPTPRYEFGLTLGGEWKGIDLSIFFQGVGKKDVYYTGSGARSLMTAQGTIYDYQLDAWTPENPDAKWPLLLVDATGSNQNYITSSYWIKSGAYCRLKNLVVGYTLPSKWTQKAFISKVRFYASMQNLFTLRGDSFYKGFDPESSVGAGASCYPVNKSFLFGLNVEF